MLTTPNLGLKKPEGTDNVNIDDFNANADVLDAAVTAKAPLDSPGLTGIPIAPTAAQGTNTTQIATTEFVNAEIAADTAGLAPKASPALTGTPTAPTAAVGTNTTQIATTQFVIGQAGTVIPKMDGTTTLGTSTKFAREDHVHPSDTSRAPLASPSFTGTPLAPTASVGTNTTQIATTAFVLANASKSPRSATLVVAASNSSTAGKASADYVCDGISDQVEINIAINAIVATTYVMETASAAAAASTSITLGIGAADYDNYSGLTITITSGTGSGQTKRITAYDVATHIATVDTAWTTIPDTTSVYAINASGGKVILLEGLYTISSSSIVLKGGVALEGQGDGTLLDFTTNSSLDVIRSEGVSVTVPTPNISVCNLSINGLGNTTGTQNGIVFGRTRDSFIKDVTVKNMRMNGIQLKDGSVNNVITGCLVQGVSYGGPGYDAIYILDSSSNVVANNIIGQNDGDGITISGATAICNVVSGNVLRANSDGISVLTSANYNNITGNTVYRNRSMGLSVQSSSFNNVTGNSVIENGQSGIYVVASDNVVVGNICVANSQSANNTYQNIQVNGSASRNNIQGNTCRAGSLTNKPTYGILIQASTCTGNFVTNNDLTTGGSSAGFSDAGTGTVTTAGNKLA